MRKATIGGGLRLVEAELFDDSGLCLGNSSLCGADCRNNLIDDIDGTLQALDEYGRAPWPFSRSKRVLRTTISS